ncbi:hypothetical protein JY96_05330 [Aquabacterium sp. NJ1]|nr:hypothetical protein JY96_05330 [Aquabacterium sp. NJ1]
MDNEPSSFDGDTQRVRILSTLESTRRPARGPMKIHGITKKKRSNWQTKALLGLMAVGVLSLLASFVMVLVNGHAASSKADAADQAPADHREATRPAAPPRVSPDNPLAALVAPPPARTAAIAPTRTEQAAVIENVAIATPVINHGANPAPAKLNTEAKAASALPVVPKSSVIATTAAATTATAKAEPAKPTVLAMATPTSQDTSKQARPAAPAGKRPQASSRNDEDVALLEAMFAHTRPRPVVESAADEIKRRCSSLSGPEAATCRARVCVQNPTAAVCHQD